MNKVENVVCKQFSENSIFVRPYHMYFTQDGRQRRWDLLKLHDSVAILIFNTSRNVLVLVKQFRPAVYLSNVQENDKKLGVTIDTKQYPAELGFTIELCAGIVDKNKTLEEIACEEVHEECGYSIKPTDLQRIISYRSGVGASGDKQTVYYAEVTDEMKTSKGGGNVDEGELIEIVEMSVDEAKEYMQREDVLSPGGFLFALTWFFRLKSP
ncbi:uridine diphosphate glucose pyrophosphatase NUDT14-like [Neocloeon triangulifer]|uniref:uridine diphosphate glucose pyrophosphatase NUDT14-like n=1 Tax=Neocloeon triangulifer TaxID=2078957 RepID=UPI00286F6A13|nr:uridine diphosphate glucose pyrophosphatase NUDT14-like [Neocloeon triangulifer]